MAAPRDLSAELYHRQRQRRAATTIGVLLLLLFFAFWYAFSYYRANSGEPDSKSTATCVPFNPKAATPANTTVNVYNSTTREGLAARTAQQLKNQGFVIGQVANDPEKKSVAGPAEVRFAKGAQAHADLLVPLGGKGTATRVVARKGVTVDFVIGKGFKALGAAPKPSGKPTCSPSPSAR